MKVNKIEIEKLLSLSPIERYRYFIKRVADSERIFILLNLYNEYALSEVDNNILFPLWSAKEYAELCLVSGWENFSIKEISLETFENSIIDFLNEKNILLNVFPVNDKIGFVVDLNEFALDLHEELKKYW